MSPVDLRVLGVPKSHSEDGEGLFRYRSQGIGQHCECKEALENHANTPIHLAAQQKPQKRGLDRYGLSSSAPPTPKRYVPMENETQEVQHRFKLGIMWGKLPKAMPQIDIPQGPY
ncbi:hypothetical protein O181_011064 [Austropuccinia psidii MF-1]|uniref:Uncharacterized protein n=1 Tax=Austropuccinia psidii MF-1 TaxID=1389203 RepID=A0A9Q3BTT6_9BASI|nr:hypothetical protein [Austropuccinia psidii MF-1]